MKNKKSLLTALLLSALMTSGFTLTGCTLKDSDPTTSITEDVGVSVEEKGVRIKYLTSGTTTEGYDYKEYSFSVEPSGAASTNVLAGVLYNDGTECSSAVEVSVDNSAKKLKVICKQAFSKQIILTVTSELNANVKATATIDYLKRTEEITLCVGGRHSIGEALGSGCCECSSYIEISESIYSKDRDLAYAYDFYYGDGVVSVDVVGDLLGKIEYDEDELIEFFNDPSILLDALTECGSNSSACEINLDSWFNYIGENNNQSASDLLANCIELWALNQEMHDQEVDGAYNYIDLTINELFVRSSDGVDATLPNIQFRLFPATLDWSEYYTSPTNINLENSAIEF